MLHNAFAFYLCSSPAIYAFVMSLSKYLTISHSGGMIVLTHQEGSGNWSKRSSTERETVKFHPQSEMRVGGLFGIVRGAWLARFVLVLLEVLGGVRGVNADTKK